ncbi:MAG: phosphate acyltransferase, partial [bacterium]
ALAYGDCAVVPEPDAAQLADIAISTADTFAALVGEGPVVALLSFSTKGSADHSSVDVIREALVRIRRERPGLDVDGELQFDAAFVPHVGAAKAPGSPTAGRANVFVFPNLAAGNIAYKITERLAGADAYGPLFQGLAAPVNDLSRGCSAEDVYNISAITAAEAVAAAQHSPQGGD